MYALFHCMINFIIIPFIIGSQRYIIHYKSQRNFITFFICHFILRIWFEKRGGQEMEEECADGDS